ncbi:MAG: DUF4249 domain-containing protein [Bacteroidales bacterium]|nr:DUF4249 domain-containing protein [Bacteroidales bacterium]
MKNSFNKSFLILFGIIFCFSCTTKTYDIELDEYTPHLAVECFFTAGEPFSVVVTSTHSNTDSVIPLDTIKDAEVRVYEDGGFMNNLEWAETNTYRPNIFFTEGVGIFTNPNAIPEVGKRYRIEVSAPGYDPVYAESTIPEKSDLSYLGHDHITEEENDFTYQYLRVFLRMQNPDTLSHFFFFITMRSYYWNNSIYHHRYPMINDPILGITTGQNDGNGYVLFSNEFIEEDYYDFHVKFYQSDTTKLENNPRVFFHLATLSEEAYHYCETLELYQELDPRFSEPVWIYSNVEGGAGVFAGINISTDSLIFTATSNTY